MTSEAPLEISAEVVELIQDVRKHIAQNDTTMRKHIEIMNVLHTRIMTLTRRVEELEKAQKGKKVVLARGVQ